MMNRRNNNSVHYLFKIVFLHKCHPFLSLRHCSDVVHRTYYV